jgi:hypothetical protein
VTLLGQNVVVRELRAQGGDDQLFGLTIRLRDKVDGRAFVIGRRKGLAVCIAQDLTRRAGDAFRSG